MSLIPPGHLAVAAKIDGRRSDLLLAADVPLASVLAELGVPAADMVGDAVSNEALRAPASATLAMGDRLDLLTLVGERNQRATGPTALGERAIEHGGLELAVVAGLESGATRRLCPGLHRLPSGPVVQVEASVPASRWAEAADRIEAFEQALLDDGMPSLLAIGPPIDIEPTRGASFRRPPRAALPSDVAPLSTPDLPPPPSPPTPLSWASLLAPLPIALAMAYFFRPLFALFGLMGPVLVLGRWFEQRRARRKQAATRSQVLAAAMASIAEARRLQAEAIARHSWQRNPHVAHLHARAQAKSVRIWERRSDDDDRLSFMVGVGPRRVQPLWESTPAAELGAACVTPLQLRSVPEVVDLVGEGGFGVHGDASAGRSVVRSALLQLATLRGPADLAIVVLGRDLRQWEWIKWLPHVHAPLLAEPDDAALWRQLHQGSAIVVVDDPEVDVAAVVRSATAAEVEVSVLSVAPTSGELPAACTRSLEIRSSGWIVGATDTLGAMDTLGVGVSLDLATDWARSLAAVKDPEQVMHQAAALLVAPTLAQSLEIEGPDDVLRLRSRVDTRAAEFGRSLPFVLGVDGTGAACFDLTTDGPHALVAGTTGSGKSELLRTLVTSLAAAQTPEQLQFVLIDFKGGGAFDGCSELPHVAGLITDLDESIVERALAGLRVEVRDREERVRARQPLTSLVVVIDEFAALAQDYPTVLDGLVDLAARGRSLGMHLILATQKPSGVVDHRIRANTNLRIALRVQHAHESHDVVGAPDAATLDRRSPGRAIVRIGSDELRTIQVCSTSLRAGSSRGTAVSPFGLSQYQAGSDEVEQSASAIGPTEPPLNQLARWVSLAGGAAAAPLWSPLLPGRYAYDDLQQRDVGVRGSGADPEAFAIGIVDRPELRDQDIYRWTPAAGALAVFSGDPDAIHHLVGGLVAAVVEGRAPVAHAYVVGDEPTAARESYPCVGAVISPMDRERVERLLSMVERRIGSEGCASLLLAITDIGSLLAGFDDLERLEIVERIEAIVRTGARSGNHLVIGARSVRDLPHRVANHIPNRLLGVVADPTAHLLLGTKPPSSGSTMHVVDVDSGAAVLLADQPTSPVAVANESVALPIVRCPEQLSSEQLPEPVPVAGGLDVALGVRYQDLAPAILPMRWGRDVLIAGPPGAGRTNTLLLLGDALQRSGTRVVSVGPGADLGFEWMDPNGVAKLAEGDSDEPVVLLVDDVERVASEAARELATVMASPARQITVVAASTIEGARAPRSVAATIRASGMGILVGGSQLDGELFRVRRPELPGLGQLPGRATLVVHGRVESVHLAIASRTA